MVGNAWQLSSAWIRAEGMPCDLIELMHYGEIDLEPEYQRDVVWTEARQEALIDSLFHNYYIPPILFALRLEDDGTERRTCSRWSPVRSKVERSS